MHIALRIIYINMLWLQIIKNNIIYLQPQDLCTTSIINIYAGTDPRIFNNDNTYEILITTIMHINKCLLTNCCF